MAKQKTPLAVVEKASPQVEEILTDAEVMERLKIKQTTLAALVNRKFDPLPCYQIRTSDETVVPIRRFRWSKVEEWLERQE